MRFFIQTFGCQMNQNDSEKIVYILNQLGYIQVEKELDADLIILNSCSVRQSAEDRIFGLVDKYYKLKLKGKNLKVLITGCMVGRDKNKKLYKKLKNKIDFYMNIQDIYNLPIILGVNTTLQLNSNYINIQSQYSNNFEASISIMGGCNNFCSYCVVPYARGREFSKDGKLILDELKRLQKNGFLSIILLGQNVNSYKPRENFASKKNPYKHPFAQLLWEVDKIGFNRVFFTASHPKDMSDEVIDAFRLKSMINYIHLPLQSGSDKILNLQNRNYTASDYLNIIYKLRKINPNIAIGTDIIVGFPTESEKDFLDTYNLYKEIKFDISYTAKYSPRSGTASFKMKDDVSLIQKEKRWKKLYDLMEDITYEKNQRFKNKICEVLVYEKNKECFIGENRYKKKVIIKDENCKIGKLYKVKIINCDTWALIGKII